jgi:SulP family sulfate permease
MKRQRSSAAVNGNVRIGIGLRDALSAGYGRADFRADAVAGIVVGVIALPLSMALAIATGVPPQNGLYTAIVAGAAVAVTGGARLQITGPTAAFVALLVPIVANHGLAGLLMAGLMAGAIQIAMGYARLGRWIELVPHPVTTGFTLGVAVVIASIQVKDVFGLDVAGTSADFAERIETFWAARDTASRWELGIAGATLAMLIALPRISRRAPAPLIALGVAALAAWLGHAYIDGFAVDTVGTRFQSVVGGEVVAGIPPLPPVPAWPWSQPGPGGAALAVDFGLLRSLLPSAFAIAMLGAIESLLSAVVADAATGQRHDPNTELVGLGIGNLLCPFFGGIPATAALARTAANIRAGGRTPISAVVHSAFVLACTVALAPLVAYLPMAALAALLLVVAYNMSEVRHFARLLRIAPGADVLVLVTCAGLTILFDMVLAVGVGVVLAALIFMRRMSELTDVRLDEGGPRDFDVPEGIHVYEIAGPLFFGAAQRAVNAVETGGAIAVVIVMDHVPVVDATGLVALESLIRSLDRTHSKAIFAGVQPEVRRAMERAGIVKHPGRLAYAPDLDAALSIAVIHAERARPEPAASGAG